MKTCQRYHVLLRPHELPGDLRVPEESHSLVIFAHGSGSSRLSPRNVMVAEALNERGIATLLFDLLTEDEADERTNVFDIPLLAGRLVEAVCWIRGQPRIGRHRLGFFGASTGAAAALVAARDLNRDVGAIVSRGGRPDLAGDALEYVTAPTLLIVGSADEDVLALNEQAAARLRCVKDLVVIPEATHLFAEPGTLEMAIAHAGRWFDQYLSGNRAQEE